MKSLIVLSIFFKFITLTNVAYADHPNEGSILLQQLLSEAESNSLEIQAQIQLIDSLNYHKQSITGLFGPQIFLEGGPQKTQFDAESNHDTAYYAKIEWNLYNGNLDHFQYNSQNRIIEIEKNKLAALKNKIKIALSQVYYSLQFILESISLKEKALELNSQQMKLAKAKNNSGFTTSSDVLEFDLRESTLKSDLVLLNQQLNQKSRELQGLLSRSTDNETIKVRGHLTRTNTQFNREQLLTSLKQQNPTLLSTSSELEKIEQDYSQAQSQFLPQLNFEGRYGKLNNDEKVFANKDNYSFMLKLSIPLFSSLTDYYKIKEINSKKTATQLSLTQTTITLTTELDATLDEIKALNQRLDLEENNIERSEKYYKLTFDEYRRGIKNSPDMVNASERLLEARIRNLEYRRDLIFAQLKLSDLTGE